MAFLPRRSEELLETAGAEAGAGKKKEGARERGFVALVFGAIPFQQLKILIGKHVCMYSMCLNRFSFCPRFLVL